MNDTCFVKNRSSGRVVYSIPDTGVTREFNPGEVKRVPKKEMVQLSYQSGGIQLIDSYLQIAADDVLRELNLKPEQEYYMSEDQIKDLLNHGSLDAFLDCLDFAPLGVIDLVKKFAVELPLNDYQKRKALKEKIGFDVDKAIQHNQESKEGDDVPVVRQRRVQEETATTNAPQRRTQSKYKVTSRQQ